MCAPRCGEHGHVTANPKGVSGATRTHRPKSPLWQRTTNPREWVWIKASRWQRGAPMLAFLCFSASDHHSRFPIVVIVTRRSMSSQSRACVWRERIFQVMTQLPDNIPRRRFVRPSFPHAQTHEKISLPLVSILPALFPFSWVCTRCPFNFQEEPGASRSSLCQSREEGKLPRFFFHGRPFLVRSVS